MTTVDLPRRRGISFEVITPGLARVRAIDLLIEIRVTIRFACGDCDCPPTRWRAISRRFERKARRRGVRPEIVQPFSGYLTMKEARPND
jgi:hypothetical protein